MEGLNWCLGSVRASMRASKLMFNPEKMEVLSVNDLSDGGCGDSEQSWSPLGGPDLLLDPVFTIKGPNGTCNMKYYSAAEAGIPVVAIPGQRYLVANGNRCCSFWSPWGRDILYCS